MVCLLTAAETGQALGSSMSLCLCARFGREMVLFFVFVFLPSVAAYPSLSPFFTRLNVALQTPAHNWWWFVEGGG